MSQSIKQMKKNKPIPQHCQSCTDQKYCPGMELDTVKECACGGDPKYTSHSQYDCHNDTIGVHVAALKTSDGEWRDKLAELLED